MGVVLDTSVLIEAEKGELNFSHFLRTSFPKESIYISSISVSELFLGAHLSKEKFQANRIISVETIINSLVVIDFDSEVAKTHANIWSQLKKEGNLIGPHDLIIAATCLHHQHSLLTSNIQEFSRVTSLILESI